MLIGCGEFKEPEDDTEPITEDSQIN